MLKYINKMHYDLEEKEYTLITTTLCIAKKYTSCGWYKRARPLWDNLQGMIELLEMQDRFSEHQIENLYEYIKNERKSAASKINRPE